MKRRRFLKWLGFGAGSAVVAKTCPPACPCRGVQKEERTFALGGGFEFGSDEARAERLRRIMEEQGRDGRVVPVP
jgi:hypothetical protein